MRLQWKRGNELFSFSSGSAQRSAQSTGAAEVSRFNVYAEGDLGAAYIDVSDEQAVLTQRCSVVCVGRNRSSLQPQSSEKTDALDTVA